MANQPSSTKQGVRTAIKWTTASNIADSLVNAMITIVLAALLGPTEYGIVALAILLINILEIIPGFGLETALIQRSNLDHKNLNAVFWFNLFCGVMFACLAMLISGWWADVNKSIQLGPVITALSVLIPLQCLSIVQSALLKRQMKFKSLAIRNILATISSGSMGIGMAFAGMGVWALVSQQLTRGVVLCVLVWMASAWRPNGQFTWSSLKPLLNFSSKTFMGQLGVYFQNNTDSIVMGFAFGPTAVGLFRFANRLIEMILMLVPRSIQLVALPHFSTLQADRSRLHNAFLKGSHVSCLVTLPLLALIAGAPEKFLGVMGAKWFAAKLSLSLLAAVGMGKVITLLVGPLLQSLSRPGINSINTWTFAVMNACGVFILAIFMRTAPPGNQAAGIALIRVVNFCFIFMPLLLWQTQRIAGLSFKDIFVSLRGTVAIGTVTFVFITILNQAGLFSIVTNTMLNIGFVVSIGALVWFVALHLFDKKGLDIIYFEICRFWNGLKRARNFIKKTNGCEITL